MIGDSYSLDMAIRTRVKDQSPSGTQRAPVEAQLGPLGPQLRTVDPLNQVHMAPFGLIFNQNRSHRVWEASGMPPGP